MDGEAPTIAASLAAIAVALGLLVKTARSALETWRARGYRRAELEARKNASVPRCAASKLAQRDLAKEFQQAMGAHRVLLIRVSNGGRVPKPDSRLNITVLVDSHASTVRAVSDDYQGRPLTDADYMRIVADLESADLLKLETVELEPGSMLRDEYESNLLVCSWLSVVERSPERLLFLSASSQNPMPEDATTRTLLRSYASRMRQLLSTDLLTSRGDDET